MDAFSHTSRHTTVAQRARKAPRRKGRPAAFISWRRQGRLVALAVALALALLAMLLLGEALGVLPGDSPLGAPAASGAPLIMRDAPTETVTPTATVPPAGTLSLVSPISHEGPTNTTLTITGAGWGASSVTLTANIGSCPTTPVSANNLTTVTTSAGAFTADPPWPTALTQPSIYTICAYDGKNPPVSGPTYSLLVGTPATLTLSPTTAQANQSVTISGANFVGVQSVTVKATAPDGSSHTIGVYPPDPSGAFQAQYVPQAADQGTVTITAQSPLDAPATVPALSVTAPLTVGAASTPTPTTEPTATTAPATTNTTGSHSPSVGVIVALVVGILLALLLIVGLIAFVIIRRNNTPGDDIEHGYGRGPDGRTPPMRRGYGETGYGRSYDPGFSEEYPSQRGYASGVRRSAGQTRGYGAEYGERTTGGVSGWDDPEPDPNWRSRPMSGRRSAPPDDSFDDLGYPHLGAPGGRNADGWDETTGGYGSDGYTDETGAYGSGGYSSGYTDESTSYSDQPVYGRRPQGPQSGPARASGGPGGPGGPSPLAPPPGRGQGRASGGPGGRSPYPDPYGATEEASTRPSGPPAGPGYGASYPGYPPTPLVPPGAGPASGPRSAPGRGGPTGGRNSGVRPAAPDPRRSGPGAPPGWDDSDDGRSGW